jgi:DNA-binding XRE family transcriptional regulator
LPMPRSTQAEAAKEIDINQRTLSTVERGGPVSLDTARKLAKWLGGAWTTDTVADAAKEAAGGGA